MRTSLPVTVVSGSVVLIMLTTVLQSDSVDIRAVTVTILVIAVLAVIVTVGSSASLFAS